MNFNNYEFEKDRIIVRTSGREKFTPGLMTSLVILDLVTVSIIGYFLSESGFFKDKPYITGAIILIVFLALLTEVILAIGKGWFSRYLVEITHGKIEVYDKRKKRTVITQTLQKNRFYIPDMKKTAGFSTATRKVVYYGTPRKIFVETTIPTEDFIMLYSGGEKQVEEFRDKILRFLDSH
jgi:hypothetical protein